jgi:hypothetical protein
MLYLIASVYASPILNASPLPQAGDLAAEKVFCKANMVAECGSLADLKGRFLGDQPECVPNLHKDHYTARCIWRVARPPPTDVKFGSFTYLTRAQMAMSQLPIKVNGVLCPFTVEAINGFSYRIYVCPPVK